MAHQHWRLFCAAGYLGGRGVNFGALPCFWPEQPGVPRGAELNPLISPTAINPGVYSIPVDMIKTPGVAGVDNDPWSIYERDSLDHIFIGPHFAAVGDQEKFLRDARSKLKPNKHLILNLRLEHEQMGTVKYTIDSIRDLVGKCGRWMVKGAWKEDGEYLIVLKKLNGSQGLITRPPSERPRACIARYGALGDAIIMTALIKALKDDGYEVTVNISTYCAPVFENNPNIDNIILQERDLVPNQSLSEYWNFWEKEYDKYINLSESIEGDLLAVEGRREFFTSKPWRQQRGDKNYYDYTLARGGYPHITGRRGELYFTEAEERRAVRFFNTLQDKFVVLWALNGSSHHKVYPLMEPTLMEWFRNHEDSVVITVGDTTASLMEFPHPQLLGKAGVWSIRESLIGAKYADLVMGPETMVTNASGCFETPKIVFLSHSTKNALTKYFINDYSLEPDSTTAPCWPCFQLHYTRESCPNAVVDDVKTGEKLFEAPICSVAIRPERVLETMEEVYQYWKAKRGVSDAAVCCVDAR